MGELEGRHGLGVSDRLIECFECIGGNSTPEVRVVGSAIGASALE